MNANDIDKLARATQDGSMPFPEIVGHLMAQGTESYQVDFPSRTFTFYSASGASLRAPITLEGLPPVAENLDLGALQAAIRDSQQHGQAYLAFCQRAMRAGVQGYFAFLRGRRVTYLGRQGDQHTEWFPCAERPEP